MQLDPAGAAEVLEVLDALEQRLAVPRIEGAERDRLRRFADGGRTAPGRDPTWEPHRLDDWYLGRRERPGAGPTVGEAGRLGGTTTAALGAAADATGIERLWLRGTDAADVTALGATGWRPARTLLVLGRALDASVGDVAAPVGLVRASVADVGTDAVAELLARSYRPAQEDGRVEADAEPWTSSRVTTLAGTALDEPGDLLVAVGSDDRPVGVHWLRRRAGGVGEVFNLAIDPGASGRGVGAWLLSIGLRRLADTGHHRVILWVDAANAPARRLYDRAGFEPIGMDVALEP